MIINSGGQNYAGENKRIKSDAGDTSEQIQDKVVNYNAKIQEQEEIIKNLEKQMEDMMKLKARQDARTADMAFTAVNTLIEIAQKPLEEEMRRRLDGPSRPYPTDMESLKTDMMRRL